MSASVLALTLKRLVAFQVLWRLPLRSLRMVLFALTPARYCPYTPELLQPPPSCSSWLGPPPSRPLTGTSARCIRPKLHVAPAPCSRVLLCFLLSDGIKSQHCDLTPPCLVNPTWLILIKPTAPMVSWAHGGHLPAMPFLSLQTIIPGFRAPPMVWPRKQPLAPSSF